MRVFLWLFAGVGILALIFIVAMVGFGAVGINMAMKLVKEANAYADETVAAYAAEWDGSTLLERGSPEFLAVIAQNPNSLNQLDAFLKERAGDVALLNPAECNDFDYKQDENMKQFVAACSATGKAEGGDLTFSLTIIKRNEDWKLVNMFVNVDPGVIENDQSVQVSFGASEPLELGEANHFAPMRFGFDDIDVAAGPNVRRINVSRGRMIDSAAGLQVGAHVSRDIMAPTLEEMRPESQPAEDMLAE